MLTGVNKGIFLKRMIRLVSLVVLTVLTIMNFQVTGRESFKKDRTSRPVKIAESDADVSESQCSQDLHKKHPLFTLGSPFQTSDNPLQRRS